MGLGGWIAAAVLAVASGGCLQASFACSSRDECVLGGVNGECVAGGCALPDPACDSDLRYHGSAPGGLAGTCVELPGTSGGPTGSSESVAASTDPTLSPSSTSDDGGSSTTDAACPGESCGCAATVVAGEAHSCGLNTSGTLYCWGENDNGEIGIGVAGPQVAQQTVVDIGSAVWPGGLDAAVGTCAIDEQQRVRCWGPNGHRVADPTAGNEDVLSPTLIDLPLDAVALQMSGQTACAIAANGSFGCWGDGEYGELGRGVGAEPGPVDPMFNVPPIEDLAVGQDHTCVLTGGEVQCWGRNTFGQLGTGSTSMQSEQPQLVGLSGPAAMIAAGDQSTCAALVDGSVECWGHNDHSETGADAMQVNQPDPLVIDTSGLDAPVARIRSDSSRHCVLTEVGSIYCWGMASNATFGVDVYKFGTPEPTPQRIPVPDRFGETPVQFDHDGNHMCVVTELRRIFCWGDNRENSVGPGEPAEGESHIEVDVCP